MLKSRRFNRTVCLNLGCGGDYRESDEQVEWINIDVRTDVKTDLVVDLERELLQGFEDGSVDEILAKDFLEHLSWRVVETFLRDCHRVLKRGGKIFIQTPDLEAIAKRVILDPDYRFGELHGWKAISFWIYGALDYPENVHKCGFTIPTFRSLLESVGFEIDEIKNDDGSNMVVKAHKP